MRKNGVFTGWSVQDPKRNRFAVSNKIWDHKLKPIAFEIFSYLCYRRSNYPAAMISLDDIARAVHVTAGTVEKYLSTLINKGIVSADWSPASNLQCGRNENFFTLPNEIFLLQLSPATFMVYAYLLLIEDRKTHTCHPSYNTIANETGMSKNTALKSISALLETGLISVEPSSYFDKRGMKWKGNNLYKILPVSLAVDIFHQRQLQRLELTTEQACIRKKLEVDTRDRTRAALWADLWPIHHLGQLPAPSKSKPPL